MASHRSHKLLEDDVALGDEFLGCERDAQAIEDDPRAHQGVAPHGIALDRPGERLSEAPDDGLGGFRIQALGVEEDAVEIEEDCGCGGHWIVRTGAHAFRL